MHSIKRAARRQAWYHNFETAETKTYNFFGRVDTRQKKPHDEELIRNNTESSVRAPPVADQDGLTAPEDPNAPKSIPADNTGKNDHHKAGFMGKFKKDKHNKDADRQDSSDAETGQKPRPNLTFMSQFKAVMGSWINLLLIFVPIGIALHFVKVDPVAVFVCNFVAIIPLAALLSYSTEELALYIGEVMGGLLNATFGNAVELIVGIIALAQGQTIIVQTSLIGSMLSNLLLVTGMCMFFGGLRRQEQNFNITVAQTAASLLALAIGSLIVPTAFKQFETIENPGGVTHASRGTAVILLGVYAAYLIFQLYTHTVMYNEPGAKTPKKPKGKKEEGEAIKSLANIGAATGAASSGGQINQENLVQEAPDEPETPQLTIIGALVTLAITTVLIALCAEFLVSSINVVANSISKEFIGLILLPIVGNAAEHATAVTVAIKDKMDLAIGVAVGSSLQIALLVLPLMIMLNWWGVGAPADLTLDFDGFLVSVLFIAIILVNYVVQDGKSNWLEGFMLQATYVIIAIAAFYFKAAGNVAG